MMRPLFGKIETLGPWTAHIQAVDQAVTENDPGEAVRAWRQAYSAALSHPGWLGLLTVAAASLRLDAFPGLARGATARASAMCSSRRTSPRAVLRRSGEGLPDVPLGYNVTQCGTC